MRFFAVATSYLFLLYGYVPTLVGPNVRTRRPRCVHNYGVLNVALCSTYYSYLLTLSTLFPLSLPSLTSTVYLPFIASNTLPPSQPPTVTTDKHPPLPTPPHPLPRQIDRGRGTYTLRAGPMLSRLALYM